MRIKTFTGTTTGNKSIEQNSSTLSSFAETLSSAESLGNEREKEMADDFSEIVVDRVEYIGQYST